MVTATYTGKLIVDALSLIPQTTFFKVIVFFMCFAKTVKILSCRLS